MWSERECCLRAPDDTTEMNYSTCYYPGGPIMLLQPHLKPLTSLTNTAVDSHGSLTYKHVIITCTSSSEAWKMADHITCNAGGSTRGEDRLITRWIPDIMDRMFWPATPAALSFIGA